MRMRALIIGSFAAIVLTMGSATTAAAEDAPFVFDNPPNVRVEYGEYWQFVGTTFADFAEYSSRTIVTSQTPGFPEPATYAYADYGNGKVGFVPSTTQPPLSVGTYAIDLLLDTVGYGNIPYRAHVTGATLEIVRAALTPSVTLAADPTTSGGMIVTGSLEGQYVDIAQQVSTQPNVPVLPRGTWTFTIKDASGTTVLEKTIDDEAGGPPGVSFYWAGATPGTDYVATGEFSIDGASASNFSVGSATPANARTDVPPQAIAVADAPTAAPAVHRSGFAVPLWAVILAALALVGLSAALAIVLVRGRKRRPSRAEPAIEEGKSS